MIGYSANKKESTLFRIFEEGEPTENWLLAYETPDSVCVTVKIEEEKYTLIYFNKTYNELFSLVINFLRTFDNIDEFDKYAQGYNIKMHHRADLRS